MKKIRVLSVFCLALAVLMPPVFGQGRPRRVNPVPSTGQPAQTTPTAPQTTSPQPGSNPNDRVNKVGRPPAPPILRGANRDPNEQKPTASATPDNGPEEYGEGDTVRIDTTLVSIPVSVMDRDGKFIPNLRQEDFHIWEDGVEQRVAYFQSVDKPFTVALLLDLSGSMKYRLLEIQDAAITFVEQLRPEDRVMVVSFSDRIRNLTPQGPTNDRFALRDAIRSIDAGSGTRLYDTVDMVINEHFNHIEGRKAIVLFSDGVDTTSKRASYETTLRDAEELDALIYPVEFDTYADMAARRGGGWPGGSGRRGGVLDDLVNIIINGGVVINGGNSGGSGGAGTSREEYERGDRYLHDLARVTGARLYNAEMQNLDFAFRSVAEELRRQYSLGYYPKSKPAAGERRGIRVRVTRPELVVRTRDSYVFQPRASSTVQTNPTQPRPPVLRR